jgi:DNA primase
VGIVDEDIGRVREATDIVAVISQYTQLKRVGQRWSGLCPFHAEKTPSFSVNAEEGFYHCFGCKVSGDAITFLREKEQLDFVGAVEALATRAGITLRYTDRDQGEGRKRQARLLELTERAAEWYHDRLRTSPDAAVARSYLRGRGFDADEVAHYRIGWAPDAWDQMARSLRVGQADLEASGLGFKNKAGRLQDFFRARILFPIMDERGRVIGFGGRKLPDADGPKYQNSRDNVLYNKSKVLYGLNWAKADAVNQGEVVICEGYTDVVGFARAGIPRAVATCGTALTEDHVRTLKRFTRRLVLAYDADDAGQAAADRVYAWEQAHDIEVAVVALPPGSDPDELARTEPATLHQAVEQARPFLAFRLERVLGAADLGSAEGRARAAAAALEVVAEHPDTLVRDQYVMDVADRCRIDAAALRTRLEEVRRRPRRAEVEAQGRPRRERGSDRRPTFGDGEPLPEEPPESHDEEPPVDAGRRDGPEHRPVPRRPPVRDGVETEALRLAVHHPDVAERYLNEALFSHPTVRAAYVGLRDADSASAAVDAADPDVAALLTRLVVETTDAKDTDVLSRLATEVGRQVLAELEAEARTAEDPLSYSQPIGWLKLNLDQLRGSKPEVETLELLLDWLGDRRRVTDQG